jgi:threonine/homoserine/homoserine lactone efflux protein
MLWAFIPIAVLITIVPGAATALVIGSAMRGGYGRALPAIAGNEVGVVAWALLSSAGVSALIIASEIAFTALKIGGALVLAYLGVKSFVAARRGHEPAAHIQPGRPFRAGFLTAMANPKLVVFFVALFPQFVPARAAVLPATLLMTALVVVFDLVWYSALAIAVGRAKHVLMRTSLARRIEQAMGAVLIGLGVRVALERR